MNQPAQDVSSNVALVRGSQRVRFGGRACLAPMSGVTDLGFRRAAQRCGASLVVTEMVAADAYVTAKEEARLRAEGQGLRPHVVQIVGRDPETLGRAAQLAEGAGADAIDINLGCPAKRVVGGLAGSALMREPALAVRIVAAVVRAVSVPVTVKMRLGWDDTNRNAPDLARRFEAEGVSAVFVHGRTRAQFYKGVADWCAIRAVRNAITIPLVANGDCCSLSDARVMLARSGADAVMIGRAALGRPWIVGAIAAGLAGEPSALPSRSARRDLAIAHYEYLLTSMGEAGVRHARKHLAGYAKAAAEDGFASAPLTAQRLVTTDNPHEVVRLLSVMWNEPMKDAA